jgi:hypothetical protein
MGAWVEEEGAARATKEEEDGETKHTRAQNEQHMQPSQISILFRIGEADGWNSHILAQALGQLGLDKIDLQALDLQGRDVGLVWQGDHNVGPPYPLDARSDGE